MGAPKRYTPPHKQLGKLAIKARQRGLSFEAFWHQAVRPEQRQRLVMVTDVRPPADCIRWPTDPKDRSEWRSAILGSKEAWKRAYHRLPPTRPEDAVRYLGDILSDLDGFPTDDDLVPA